MKGFQNPQSRVSSTTEGSIGTTRAWHQEESEGRSHRMPEVSRITLDVELCRGKPCVRLERPPSAGADTGAERRPAAEKLVYSGCSPSREVPQERAGQRRVSDPDGRFPVRMFQPIRKETGGSHVQGSQSSAGISTRRWAAAGRWSPMAAGTESPPHPDRDDPHPRRAADPSPHGAEHVATRGAPFDAGADRDHTGVTRQSDC